MASGDITKEFENDKIEVVQTWNIQVRKAIKIMEELSDGSKKEISRSFERYVLVPFNSVASKDSDGKITGWTHTATDLSSVDADVKAVATGIWTDDVKAKYKTFRESQSV